MIDLQHTRKAQIEALPERERAARRLFYTDDEWESLWELQALPYQLPPAGEWDSWTVIAPPRLGKTRAGFEWMLERHLNADTGEHNIILIAHQSYVSDIALVFYERLQDLDSRGTSASMEPPNRYRFRKDNGAITGIYPYQTIESLRGFNPRHVWADEVFDAQAVRDMFPLTEKFCFTGPTRLDQATIVTKP